MTAERWTKERRLAQTRNLLVDAAEGVFARKGFNAATLDDIAATAGYTRGAFYVHFKTKEELFFAVSDRYWKRYFENFAELLSSVTSVGDKELDEIAERWMQLSKKGGAQHAALGYEFTLYLERNPAARARVADKRREVVEELTKFVVSGVERLGAEIAIPAEEFAQILIATSDSITLASDMDDIDLFRPTLRMLTSVITAKEPRSDNPA